MSLVISTEIASELRVAAQGRVESAGVIIAGLAVDPRGDVRVLAQEIVWVPDDAYLVRAEDELVVGAEGFVPALARAGGRGAVGLWVHTHPGDRGVPLPSGKDQAVDDAIADVFRIRTGREFYGSAIFSPAADGLRFSGIIQFEGRSSSIDHLVQVGDRLRLTQSFDTREQHVDPIFDRQVKAFGTSVQGTLGLLRIGIVGCGGTGSAVAEQLVRLGVRHLTLVDFDRLTKSNVTRVYGSTPNDVGRPKVDLMRDHLARIAPEVDCRTIHSTVTRLPAVRELIGCDVIFGCTDDNAGRLVMSRMPTYLLTTLIDCGVLLSSDAEGRLMGIDGRVTVISPGAACLVCRGRIDVRRAAAELLTQDEYVKLEREGYAPALGNTEPAVVAFTTAVASAAVAELLERLVGYGPEPVPTEILLRLHEREVSTNSARPRPRHYCHAASGKTALGVTDPFLEQVWAQ